MDENIGFEEQLLEVLPEQDGEIVRSFATVGGVYEDGLSLIFDGEEEETQKHYLCNTSVTFAAGDRVKITQDSGTYIVEYVVGPPNGGGETVHGLPAGGTQGQLLTKASATDYDAAWANAPDVTQLKGAWHSIDFTDASTMHAELVPSAGPSASNGIDLGSSQKPFKNVYLGGGYGSVSIGGNNSLNSKIGFFGATPAVKQTISLTTNNMSYSSVTASNYLYALNNLIGILKNKLGLID